MGISWIHRSELYHLHKMKFLVVAVSLFGAAYAEAEADADAYYGYYGYGLRAYAGHGYYGYPYAYGAYAHPYAYGLAGLKSAPCVNAANVPVPCASYGKRSADAEPEAEAEADAAVLYGAYGYPYGLGAYGYGAFGYAGYPYGLTYGAGVAATNNVLGHAVAYTAGGVTHSSNVGVSPNSLGAQVPC